MSDLPDLSEMIYDLGGVGYEPLFPPNPIELGLEMSLKDYQARYNRWYSNLVIAWRRLQREKLLEAEPSNAKSLKARIDNSRKLNNGQISPTGGLEKS